MSEAVALMTGATSFKKNASEESHHGIVAKHAGRRAGPVSCTSSRACQPGTRDRGCEDARTNR